MPAISKTTSNKLTFARSVLDALDVHGPTVVPKFKDWIFAGESPRALTIEALFAQLQKRLRESSADLEAKDLAHQVELADDAEPRERRGASVTTLREALASSAELVRSVFGAAYARQAGLGAPLEEKPELLIKQARTIAQRLRDTPPPAPTRRSAKGVSVIEEAKLLEEDALALENARGDVSREEREAQRSMLARDEAETQWGVAYTLVGDVFASAAVAVGLVDLAERVRPTPRRRMGIAEPTEPGARDDAEPRFAPPTPSEPIEPGMPGASPFRDEPR